MTSIHYVNNFSQLGGAGGESKQPEYVAVAVAMQKEPTPAPAPAPAPTPAPAPAPTPAPAPLGKVTPVSVVKENLRQVLDNSGEATASNIGKFLNRMNKAKPGEDKARMESALFYNAGIFVQALARNNKLETILNNTKVKVSTASNIRKFLDKMNQETGDKKARTESALFYNAHQLIIQLNQ